MVQINTVPKLKYKRKKISVNPKSLIMLRIQEYSRVQSTRENLDVLNLIGEICLVCISKRVNQCFRESVLLAFLTQ